MSVLPIGISGPMSKKMFAQSAPAVKNYVNLDLVNPYGGQEDSRVAYYKKRGIGEVVPIAGAPGLGSGISHTVYRVPKSQLLTRNEVRKIEKNEYDTMMTAQAAERAAAAVVRQGEMNANVAGIVYTNEPTTKMDIDLPIHLESLLKKGEALAKDEKKVKLFENNPRMKSLTPGKLEKYIKVSVDDIIQGLRNKFIETEKGKVYHSSHVQAESKAPKNSYGKVILEYQGTVPKERDRLVQEHIDRKMPKIEAVLEKIREGMIMGFAPPPAKVEPKEENLLRFNNLSSINFSAPATTATSTYVDPFEGLNASPNVTHANFVAAGIEIEPETVNHLTKNQRSELLTSLKSMNKSEHNAAINSFIEKALRKGGKRKTRKMRKSKKTRKVKRT